MSAIRIAFDVSALAYVVGDKLRRAVEAVDNAVGDIAVQTAKNWVMAIQASPLPQAQKNEYSLSLRINQTAPGCWEVASEYDQADKIENGRPARDLKRYLNTSARARSSKAGKKYLIIPFRHNTPGNSAHAKDMPEAVFKQAVQMGKSSITSTTTRLSANGVVVPQHKYKWDKAGDAVKSGKDMHLSPGALRSSLAPKLQARHKVDIFAGMRRMETSAGNSKSSAYLTFRVMSQDSSGWIVPAKPALNIARKVAEDMQRNAAAHIQAVIAEAIR